MHQVVQLLPWQIIFWQILEEKNNWINQPSKDKLDLEIESLREKDVAGIHNCVYENENDFIEIKHTAKNRIGFAYGAIAAARFIHNKVGVYGMSELLNQEMHN